MRRIADIAVYSEHGDLTLVVEVKTRTKASREWASELYHDFANYFGAVDKNEGSGRVVHRPPFGAPYFLLALPNVVYLWDSREIAGDLLESPRAWAEWSTSGARQANQRGPRPTYVASTREALAPYLEDPEYPLEDLGEVGLEMLVSSWISELVEPWYTEEVPEGLRGLVIGSGLHEAVRGGTVKLQAMA